MSRNIVIRDTVSLYSKRHQRIHSNTETVRIISRLENGVHELDLTTHKFSSELGLFITAVKWSTQCLVNRAIFN